MLRSVPKHQYSRDEVRRMLGISERRLRSWERLGFITALDTFSFPDLVALKTLQKLRQCRIKPKQINDAMLSLKRKLVDVAHPLAELKIMVSNGRTITVQVAGQRMDAMSGQILFDFEAELSGVQALPAVSKNNKLQRERQAEHYFAMGLDLEERSNPEQAAAAYLKAVELNPAAAGAWVNLGTIEYRRRAYLRAEEYYRNAIEADPNYPLAHFNLGNLYDEEGNVTKAHEYYANALKLSPQYADAHFNLALLCERSGEKLKAVRHYTAYLKLDASSTWAETARKQLEKLKKTTLIRSK